MPTGNTENVGGIDIELALNIDSLEQSIGDAATAINKLTGPVHQIQIDSSGLRAIGEEIGRLEERMAALETRAKRAGAGPGSGGGDENVANKLAASVSKFESSVAKLSETAIKIDQSSISAIGDAVRSALSSANGPQEPATAYHRNEIGFGARRPDSIQKVQIAGVATPQVRSYERADMAAATRTAFQVMGFRPMASAAAGGGAPRQQVGAASSTVIPAVANALPSQSELRRVVRALYFARGSDQSQQQLVQDLLNQPGIGERLGEGGKLRRGAKAQIEEANRAVRQGLGIAGMRGPDVDKALRDSIDRYFGSINTLVTRRLASAPAGTTGQDILAAERETSPINLGKLTRIWEGLSQQTSEPARYISQNVLPGGENTTNRSRWIPRILSQYSPTGRAPAGGAPVAPPPPPIDITPTPEMVAASRVGESVTGPAIDEEGIARTNEVLNERRIARDKALARRLARPGKVLRGRDTPRNRPSRKWRPTLPGMPIAEEDLAPYLDLPTETLRYMAMTYTPMVGKRGNAPSSLEDLAEMPDAVRKALESLERTEELSAEVPADERSKYAQAVTRARRRFSVEFQRAIEAKSGRAAAGPIPPDFGRGGIPELLAERGLPAGPTRRMRAPGRGKIRGLNRLPGRPHHPEAARWPTTAPRPAVRETPEITGSDARLIWNMFQAGQFGYAQDRPLIPTPTGSATLEAMGMPAAAAVGIMHTPEIYEWMEEQRELDPSFGRTPFNLPGFLASGIIGSPDVQVRAGSPKKLLERFVSYRFGKSIRELAGENQGFRDLEEKLSGAKAPKGRFPFGTWASTGYRQAAMRTQGSPEGKPSRGALRAMLQVMGRMRKRSAEDWMAADPRRKPEEAALLAGRSVNDVIQETMERRAAEQSEQERAKSIAAFDQLVAGGKAENLFAPGGPVSGTDADILALVSKFMGSSRAYEKVIRGQATMEEAQAEVGGRLVSFADVRRGIFGQREENIGGVIRPGTIGAIDLLRNQFGMGRNKVLPNEMFNQIMALYQAASAQNEYMGTVAEEEALKSAAKSRRSDRLVYPKVSRNLAGEIETHPWNVVGPYATEARRLQATIAEEQAYRSTQERGIPEPSLKRGKRVVRPRTMRTTRDGRTWQPELEGIARRRPRKDIDTGDLKGNAKYYPLKRSERIRSLETEDKATEELIGVYTKMIEFPETDEFKTLSLDDQLQARINAVQAERWREKAGGPRRRLPWRNRLKRLMREASRPRGIRVPTAGGGYDYAMSAMEAASAPGGMLGPEYGPPAPPIYGPTVPPGVTVGQNGPFVDATIAAARAAVGPIPPLTGGPTPPAGGPPGGPPVNIGGPGPIHVIIDGQPINVKGTLTVPGIDRLIRSRAEEISGRGTRAPRMAAAPGPAGAPMAEATRTLSGEPGPEMRALAELREEWQSDADYWGEKAREMAARRPDWKEGKIRKKIGMRVKEYAKGNLTRPAELTSPVNYDAFMEDVMTASGLQAPPATARVENTAAKTLERQLLQMGVSVPARASTRGMQIPTGFSRELPGRNVPVGEGQEEPQAGRKITDPYEYLNQLQAQAETQRRSLGQRALSTMAIQWFSTKLGPWGSIRERQREEEIGRSRAKQAIDLTGQLQDEYKRLAPGVMEKRAAAYAPGATARQKEDYQTVRGSFLALGKQVRESEKSMNTLIGAQEELTASAVTGSEEMQHFAASLVGGIAGGVLGGFAGVFSAAAMQMIAPAMAQVATPVLDAISGWGQTQAKTVTDLAQVIQGAKGFTGVAMAGQYANIPSAAIATAGGQEVATTALVQASVTQLTNLRDLFRASSSTGSVPKNLTETTTGMFGTMLFGQGNIAETIASVFSDDMKSPEYRQQWADTLTALTEGAVTFRPANTEEERRAQMKVANDFGLDAVNIAGMVVTAGGKLVTSIEEMAAALMDLVKAMQYVKPEQMWDQMIPQLREQAGALTLQRDYAISTLNPISRFMQYFQNVPTSIGAGVIPNPQAGFLYGYERGNVNAEFPGIDPTTEQTYTSMSGRIAELRSQLRDLASAGERELRRLNVPEATIQSYKDLGYEIAIYKQRVADIQTNLRWTQHQRDLYLANRAVADASALAGKRYDKELGTVGAYQRQLLLINRQNQALSLMLQKRQIMTSLAMARFQSPGETPEERYWNRYEAEKKAQIELKQYGLAEQSFRTEIKLVDEQNLRALQDALYSLADIGRQWNASNQIAMYEKMIESAQILQASLTPDLEAMTSYKTGFELMIKGVVNVIMAQTNSTIQQVYDSIGTKISEFIGTLDADLQQLAKNNAWLIAPDSYSYGTDTHPNSLSSGTSSKPKSSAKPSDAPSTESWTFQTPGGPGRSASGIVGYAAGETSMIVGEAGGEAVAVLKRPRVSASPGSNGSPITLNVTLNYSGGSPGDADRMIQDIVREVERCLSIKGQLMGVRSAAY